MGTSVYITDPEYAKQILVTNSSRYARPENLRKLLPALGNGLITSNGKEHALLRKHLNPAFSHASIKEFMPIFNKKAAQFVKVKTVCSVKFQNITEMTDSAYALGTVNYCLEVTLTDACLI